MTESLHSMGVEDTLPCKVCGSTHQSVIPVHFPKAPSAYIIKCRDCGEMYSSIRDTVEECVTSWNELNRQEAN